MHGTAATLTNYIASLPTLNAIRLCHRFGAGRFTDLARELLDHIEIYVTGPGIDKTLEDWAKASRCFEGNCSIHDDVNRDDLITLWHSHEEGIGPILDSDRNCEDPDRYDFDNIAFVTMAHHWLDQVKDNWKDKVLQVFSKANRALFTKHFGLDIWFSFVTLDPHGTLAFDNGASRETLAYLTLPAMVARTRLFAMPIIFVPQPSKVALQKFPRALKVLGLETFIHYSQRGPSLKLGSDQQHANTDDSKVSSSRDKSKKYRAVSAASFPRPMLLVRNRPAKYEVTTQGNVTWGDWVLPES